MDFFKVIAVIFALGTGSFIGMYVHLIYARNWLKFYRDCNTKSKQYVEVILV